MPGAGLKIFRILLPVDFIDCYLLVNIDLACRNKKHRFLFVIIYWNSLAGRVLLAKSFIFIYLTAYVV